MASNLFSIDYESKQSKPLFYETLLAKMLRPMPMLFFDELKFRFKCFARLRRPLPDIQHCFKFLIGDTLLVSERFSSFSMDNAQSSAVTSYMGIYHEGIAFPRSPQFIFSSSALQCLRNCNRQYQILSTTSTSRSFLLLSVHVSPSTIHERLVSKGSTLIPSCV